MAASICFGVNDRARPFWEPLRFALWAKVTCKKPLRRCKASLSRAIAMEYLFPIFSSISSLTWSKVAYSKGLMESITYVISLIFNSSSLMLFSVPGSPPAVTFWAGPDPGLTWALRFKSVWPTICWLFSRVRNFWTIRLIFESSVLNSFLISSTIVGLAGMISLYRVRLKKPVGRESFFPFGVSIPAFRSKRMFQDARILRLNGRKGGFISGFPSTPLLNQSFRIPKLGGWGYHSCWPGYWM